MAEDPLNQDEIDSLLEQAEQIGSDTGGLGDSVDGAGYSDPTAQPLEMSTAARPVRKDTIDLLLDVDLDVKIELGRTKLTLEQVLRLGSGAVVELQKLAGDPLDILVNEQPIARGEVLILNDNFCVRVTEILAPEDRRAALAGARDGEAGDAAADQADQVEEAS